MSLSEDRCEHLASIETSVKSAKMGKGRTLLVFGKPLRTCEALKIWAQHHGIEHFWRQLKSSLHLSACVPALSRRKKR